MKNSRIRRLQLLALSLLVGCGGLPPMQLDEEHEIAPGIYGTRYFQQESQISAGYGHSVYFVENRSGLPLCARASGDPVIVDPGQKWRVGAKIEPPRIRLASVPANRDCKSVDPGHWKVGIR